MCAALILTCFCEDEISIDCTEISSTISTGFPISLAAASAIETAISGSIPFSIALIVCSAIF